MTRRVLATVNALVGLPQGAVTLANAFRGVVR
ncbi:hypothetical protein JOF41_006875 [Saccharothrix coeruleofusca]|nr:hypothetical protein [Saccharothrix coeruleofusca]